MGIGTAAVLAALRAPAAFDSTPASKSSTTLATVPEVTFVARYCDLVGQFYETARTRGALTGGVVGGPAPVLEGVLGVLGVSTDEMAAVAPEVVKPDVATVIGALQAAAGGDASATAGSVYRDAARRMAEHREVLCTVAEPSAGGDS